MRFLYTFFLYLALPFIVLRLMFKGRKNPAYRARLAERFAWHQNNATPVDVWLHAVSFGEVVAAKTLIETLLKANKRVLVTTMTPTGSEQALRLFGTRIQHQYIPYDFPFAVRRFFKAYAPRVGIIMETEIWPNLIVEATSCGVALFLANGRISDAAYPAYQRIKWFFKPILMHFTGIFAQSSQDAERFCVLGAPETNVHVLGNMKSDLFVPDEVDAPVRFLKQLWGEARPVVVAASTHAGEEQLILSVLKPLQQLVPDVVLLIAPRHPERFDEVHKLAKTHTIKTGRRTDETTIDEQTEVVVLDSLGELLGFYALSDYAFVGGSLVSIGGHNVLEPMALGVPVFCGPFMQNSKDLCEALVKVRAITQVQDAKTVVREIGALHQDASARDAGIKRATEALKANQGAVARHVDAMASYWA
jgi:3-deoxy-D-manno-octulosonic-acid transferase